MYKRLHVKGSRPERAVSQLIPCRVCLNDFKPYRRKQKFCSPECRLIFFGARRFVGAYRAGRADGLSDLIRELEGRE